MDISRIQASTSSALQQARTDESDEVRQGRKAGVSRTGDAAASDAIDLQSAAAEAPELTAARTALRQIDTLDDARKADILAKIKNGFYTQPDTISQVAGAMADALQSGKK